ncbi:MAG: ECF transporter S component [Lachnospiraceae bacterium]|nr:ECF transporter S component [Lachnospiraceae bacterium]
MNSNFIEEVSKNVTFVLEFLGIILALFVVAFVMEKLAKKRTGDTERILSTRKMAMIGMFSAIAAILHIMDFALPFIAPPFYKLDFSELPALIGAYAFGPFAGVMIEFLKILLKLIFKGTSTAFVGDLANFAVGCSFILPASVIYDFNKKKKTAILSCVVGTIVLTVFGTMFNALYLIPAFSALYGLGIEEIIAMGTSINKGITDLTSFVIIAVAPLNLIKGSVVSLITLLVYKKISPILKSRK